MHKSYVVGNWKMMGHKASIQALIENLIQGEKAKPLDPKKIEVVLCPPFPYLDYVHELIHKTHFKLGAQNLYYQEQGAFTGEVSPKMLVELGCQYVILGHSERRSLFLESNSMIARKVQAAYDVGLCPILCVGETQQERQAGKTLEVVQSQLQAVLAQTGASVFQHALLAYEPIWAIGTGQTPSPMEIAQVHAGLRNLVPGESLRILYGGSVTASNAAALFSEADIEGALVGGASLDAEAFLRICESSVCNK